VATPARTTTALANRPVLWKPNRGPQRQFLASTANEILYGGAAGGGKSSGLVALPLRWAQHPNFRALILRRESSQLGDLIDKAEKLYPKAFKGVRSKQRGDSVRYFFPSGAQVLFNHCQHERHAQIYDGHEFQLVEFDELTHFVRSMYTAIRARIRSPHKDLPRYTRSTTNPGGEGHEWVFQRWGPWLNPKFKGRGIVERRDPETSELLPPAAPGAVLWVHQLEDEAGTEVFVTKTTCLCLHERSHHEGHDRSPDGVSTGRCRHDGCRCKGYLAPLSRTFIPAKLDDNPHLVKNDPGYKQQILGMDVVRRKQLLHGDWLVKAAPGIYFKRHYFKVIPRVPPGMKTISIRYWDRAATEPSKESPDPDWTVGLKYTATEEGRFIIEHVARDRKSPAGVFDMVSTYATQDGIPIEVGIEGDPGQAGKFEAATYKQALAGFNVHIYPALRDKETRAAPASSAAEHGLIDVLEGEWHDDFFSIVTQFPKKGVHDDDVDALSGAHQALTIAVARLRARGEWKQLGPGGAGAAAEENGKAAAAAADEQADGAKAAAPAKESKMRDDTASDAAHARFECAECKATIGERQVHCGGCERHVVRTGPRCPICGTGIADCPAPIRTATPAPELAPRQQSLPLPEAAPAAATPGRAGAPRPNVARPGVARPNPKRPGT
jgi:predicted phage terminase large subunit-like protein